MTSWVDSHCHLFSAEEPAAVLLDRAEAVGVAWVVCPGTDAATSSVAADLAADERVLFTAGLHPHEASQWRQQRDVISELAVTAAAVGECGLDFYRDLSPREAQLEAFTDQLALAEQLGKPVVVHCRDAFAEVYGALERADAPRAVMHCWTGGPRWTRRFAELGVTFSYAGPLAFATGDTVRRGAEVAPRDRTMVETDTPYLSPPPHRGESNEPARVTLIGRALAAVWDEPLPRVAELTSVTAERVFR